MYNGITAAMPQDDFIMLDVWKWWAEVFGYETLSTSRCIPLSDKEMFNTAYLSFDTVAWKNEVDLAPESLYKNSIPITKTR